MQDGISQQTPITQNEVPTEIITDTSESDAGKPDSDEEGQQDSDKEQISEGQPDSDAEGQRDSGDEQPEETVQNNTIKVTDETTQGSSHSTGKKPSFLGVTRIRGIVRFEKELGRGAFGQVYKGNGMIVL